jgi:predicted ArsR family transcriptional regulator
MGRKLEIVSILVAGPLSTAQIADRMRVSAGVVRHHLQDLEAAGAVAPTANKKSPLNKWVLVSPDERPES